RARVKALHAADIEVIIDVVYNHTAEGDQRGPIYSYKGIDNGTFYESPWGVNGNFASWSGFLRWVPSLLSEHPASPP
ncbi:MAG TPA: hypothetical protein VLM40_10070, partial [Gemmata sp.]|nr:hypothetical protein [Gemmata sp.]